MVLDENLRGNFPPRKERFRRHTKEERRGEKKKLKKRQKKAAREKKRHKTSLACQPAPRREHLQIDPSSRAAMILDLARRKRHHEPELIPVPSRKIVRMQPAVAVPAMRPRILDLKLKNHKVAKEERHQQVSRNSGIPRIRREDLAPLVASGGKSSLGKIGSGSYGKCEKMLYRGNMPVVVKTFRSHVRKEEVIHEAKAMLALQSPEHYQNLPLILGAHYNWRPYVLVTQFFGDQNMRSFTLGDAVKKGLFSTEKEWAVAFESLGRTVSYVHSKNWLHNDIKQNNVVCHMVQKKWELVLIDFGKSCKIIDAKPSTKAREHEKYPWVAPEVISAEEKPTTASDIYSLGYSLQYVLERTGVESAQISLLARSCLSKRPGSRPSTQAFVRTLVAIRK